LICHISLAPQRADLPSKNIVYAELAEYTPELDHFHIVLSAMEGSRATFSSLALRCRYWTIAGMVKAPVMSLIQATFTSASTTVQRLRHRVPIAATRSRACSSKDRPSSQGSSQKSVFSLLPTWHAMEALTKAIKIMSEVTGNSDQGLELSHFWRQTTSVSMTCP
jgi:hypothetical protein